MSSRFFWLFCAFFFAVAGTLALPVLLELGVWRFVGYEWVYLAGVDVAFAVSLVGLNCLK